MRWRRGLVALGALGVVPALLHWPELRALVGLDVPMRAAAPIVRRLIEHPEALVEPRPLAPLHRSEAELRDCLACHSLTRGVRDEKCLECHEAVGERIEQAIGHHGRVEGPCAACHADHADSILAFDRDAFNHRQALYPLEGRHADVECEACHEVATRSPLQPTRLAFLGLRFESCADCHEDPHEGEFEGGACERCHTPAGWTGPHLAFDHDTMTAFPLDAAHRPLACQSCHPSLVFRPVPADCAGCHVVEAGFLEGRVAVGEIVETWRADPHAGKVACKDCHDTTRRHPSLADHANRCATCHTEHYARLYVDRRAHLAHLESTARALLTAGEGGSAPSLAILDSCVRVGSHDYVEAEKRLQALVESLVR